MSALRRRFATLFACITAITLAIVVGCAGVVAARPPYRGVQLHIWAETTDAEMDHELDLAAQAGSTAVRVDVTWAGIEELGKGQFSPSYVERVDRFMAGAATRNMKVIATLWATPCWASTAPESEKQGCVAGTWHPNVVNAAPANAADYGDAVHWMTARYGTRLAALEVWNEPNLRSAIFWRSGPGAYASLVKAAYAAAKAGNARVPVLAGALSGSDAAYLAQLYAKGIRGSYDGVSVHPYHDPGFVAMSALHAAQLAAGDRTPVWATEFGYPTGSDPRWSVSEADQGANLKRDLADFDRLDWVQGAAVFNLRDEGTNAASREENFGVVRYDFTPKPSYLALKEALTSPPARAPRPRMRLRLAPRRGSVYAVGSAPSRSVVRLTVGRCSRSRPRELAVRAPRGRFSRRLGRRTKLAGCRVTAGLRGRQAAVASARVR